MHRIAVLVASLLGIFIAAPASAQVVITQAKALAGGVTPGDTAGYPITISQPGAYRLESNLNVPAGQYGIFVGANNVDIDMNGFTLTGSGVGNYALISNSGESRIHDGVINRFKNSGLYLRNNAWVIEDMQIVRNGGSGIDATGFRFIRVEDSTIAVNGNYGIVVGDSAMIRNNIVSLNVSIGIICNLNCQMEDNKVEGDASAGISIQSGHVSQNTISGFLAYGLNDIFRRDVALIDNTFIDNSTSPAIPFQVSGGIFVYGNTCVGKPCTAP